MSFQTFCGKDPNDAATYQKLLGEFMEGGANVAQGLGSVLQVSSSAFVPNTTTKQDATDFDTLGCVKIETGIVGQGNNLSLVVGEAGDNLQIKGATLLGSLLVGNGANTESLPVGANGLVLKANSNSITGLGVEWAVDGTTGITGVSAGTNIGIDNTNPIVPIINFATPTTSDIQIGVGQQIIAKDNYATPIYTMSIDSTGLNDTYLSGLVENKEDIAVSATDVVQTLSATNGSTYTNTAVIQTGTGGSQAFISSFNPAAASSQYLRLEATMGGDFNIEHQSNTASRNLAITSNQNLTLGADNIDLSSTGRLILPSLASADRLDYNAGTLNLKTDNVGYTTDDLLLLENTNATAGNTTGVPSLEMYKSGRNGATNDVVSTILFNAKDGAGVKRTFGKIESSITTNIAPANYDGSLDFYSLVNGVNNLVFRLNGADNENNSFRPLDLNGNALKTSTGDVSIQGFQSSGNGDIFLQPKITSAVNIVGNMTTPFTSYTYKVGDVSTQQATLGATSVGFNDSVNLIASSLSNTTLTIANGTTQKQTQLTTDILNMNDNINQKSININNDVGNSPTQNRIDLQKIVGGGIYTQSSLVNDTTNQSLTFLYQDNALGYSLTIDNNSASGGVINYTNQISSGQPFTIDSSTGELILKTIATQPLTLNSDILNLANTNTTTATSNHNADIRTTSTGVSTATFLKLQLNGTDIWVPYFTTDPSL